MVQYNDNWGAGTIGEEIGKIEKSPVCGKNIFFYFIQKFCSPSFQLFRREAGFGIKPGIL